MRILAGLRLPLRGYRPAPVQDAYHAVPQPARLAGRWGADPDRIALLGSSAGATLAALTAIRAAGRGPELRTLLINPQLDWTDRSGGLKGVAPTHIAAAGPDPLEDQSAAYAERLRCAGGEVTLSRYAGATHAFPSMPGAVPATRPAHAERRDHLRRRVNGPAGGGQRATAPDRRVQR